MTLRNAFLSLHWCVVLTGLAAAVLPAVCHGEETTSAQKKIRVALYADTGVTKKGLPEVEKCFSKEQGFEVTRVSSEEIRNGGLTDFDVLIHPGGSGSGQAKALGEEGRKRVRKFAEDGGGVVGICAGAYLLSAEYPWALKLLDARVVDDEHWARGIGQAKLRIQPPGKTALNADVGVTEIHYENGPLLGPAEKDDIPDFESLATFDSEIRENDAPKGVMRGTTAIARGKFGKGRIVSFSPHPEKTKACHPFLPAAANWAAGLAPMVGEEVSLRGRFDGPGKLADYLITDGHQVYLKGDTLLEDGSIPYGTEIFVRGKLQRYLATNFTDSKQNEAREPQANCPTHYFIESAELVEAPPQPQRGDRQ